MFLLNFCDISSFFLFISSSKCSILLVRLSLSLVLTTEFTLYLHFQCKSPAEISSQIYDTEATSHRTDFGCTYLYHSTIVAFFSKVLKLVQIKYILCWIFRLLWQTKWLKFLSSPFICSIFVISYIRLRKICFTQTSDFSL